MASHLNLIVCKDIKFKGRIGFCLRALLRDWMRCAICCKKHIHLISTGSKYDFLCCCFQQVKHLNNGISKWEASNIKYGNDV
jgi:hypothetical protein